VTGATWQLSSTQRNVVFQLVAGGTASLAAIAGAYFYLPFSAPSLASAGDRVAFALRWDAVAALALVLGVLRVVRVRFTSAARIDGSPPAPDEASFEIDRRYMQNTLEQLVLAVIAHVALAAQLTGDALRLVPILAVWFLIARVAYLVGYQRQPLARGFGWAMTWLPTLWALVFDVYSLFGS
jgi:uncharacterized membrane protein YecN with MAPEG domain